MAVVAEPILGVDVGLGDDKFLARIAFDLGGAVFEGVDGVAVHDDVERIFLLAGISRWREPNILREFDVRHRYLHLFAAPSVSFGRHRVNLF